MQLVIADILTPEDLSEIRSALAAMRFEDGASRGNDLFALTVRPKALTPLLFSRYGPGQAYGAHVDNPLMDGLRTDVSFTLFLSEPATYDGGELVIETMWGEEEVKLPAGH